MLCEVVLSSRLSRRRGQAFLDKVRQALWRLIGGLHVINLVLLYVFLISRFIDNIRRREQRDVLSRRWCRVAAALDAAALLAAPPLQIGAAELFLVEAGVAGAAIWRAATFADFAVEQLARGTNVWFGGRCGRRR